MSASSLNRSAITALPYLFIQLRSTSVHACVLCGLLTRTLTSVANRFLIESFSFTFFSGSLWYCCQSSSRFLPLADGAAWIKRRGVQLAGELTGGKEGIDLSVVLGDQLIPIVCASTDSPMCLICYGLFLLRQDKSLSHHFALWATNQIKSKKGVMARRGFLPRLWLADHNKGSPSIWKVVCAE